MPNRAEKEQRRQERLARERAEAVRIARRTERRWYGGIAAMLAAAAIVLVVSVSGGSGHEGGGATLAPVNSGTPAVAALPTKGEPRPIAANLRDGNKVLDGQVKDRLHSLSSVPVVVNMWASWCPNCRAEFPFFQHLSTKYASSVAFLGLDSQDQKANAATFLRSFPVNYPSVFDESASQAMEIGAGRGWPTTIFYDRTGHQTFVHEGGYANAAALEADLRRYALGA